MAKIERVIRGKNPVDALKHLSDEEMARVVPYIGNLHARELDERWSQWAHEGQLPTGDDWRVWLIRAGRGFGKTRAGAEWVNLMARENGNARIALVGATIEDVRKVMIEGESGLLRLAHTGDDIEWHAGKGEVVYGTGALAHVYSAECYEKLRGPEHSHAWCDELGKWNHADDCWDNMMLGLRLGEKPRVVVTTTPRSIKLFKRLEKEAGVLVLRGGTAKNHNLPGDFVATVKALYEGTRWGRQEIEGELIEDVEGALWSRDLIERQRVPLAPDMKRIVIGVDPPVSQHGDACGIVAVGLGAMAKPMCSPTTACRAHRPRVGAGSGRRGRGMECRPRGRRGQSGRQYGRKHIARGRSGDAGQARACQPGQVGAGRTGGGALRGKAGVSCWRVSRAGRPDVRADFGRRL